MSTIPVEKPFAARYTVDVVDDIPPGADVVDLVATGSAPLFTVEVTTEAGGWWVGVVLAGPPPVSRAVSGVWTTPDPTTMCVVGAGDAVLVAVDDDAEAGPGRRVPGDPVTSVLAAPDDGLLLLATPWTVTAVGADGIRWTTDRLAIDGLELRGVLGDRLTGVADPDLEGGRGFTVDLATGTHEGGNGPFG